MILTGDTGALCTLQVNFMLNQNYCVTTMRMSAVDGDEIEVISLKRNYTCGFFFLKVNAQLFDL